ncbi:MAG: hypothetical protein GY854_24520 [Deltaproteobacteria bacterium]|nr:hypothetical protein [Deltaproteobacteria bacterium]
MKMKLVLFASALSAILVSGCRCDREKPPPKPRPIRISTPSGVETAKFQMHDTIIFEANGLQPRTRYNIRVIREDTVELTRLVLSTDRNGHIPETVLLYDLGMLPCWRKDSPGTSAAALTDYDISDAAFAGQSYSVQILRNEEVIRKTVFQVAKEITRPRLYVTNAQSCPKSGFLIGEEDVWVVGRNFPKGSIVKLWAVDADSEWKDSTPLVDRTKQYGIDQPPIFALKPNETSFKKKLWPKALTSLGSYDVVAEVVTYPFGTYRATSTAAAQNVVENLKYSGFVIQRRPGEAEPLEMDIAGTVSSPFSFRNAFLTDEDVYVGIDPCIQPSYVGNTADVYIVADKTAAAWATDQSLTDVTGGPDTLTVGGICGNCWKTLAWPANLVPGEYDVVLDFNQDGVYTPGGDLIDGLDNIGFTVAEIRVESVSFNYATSGAITIFDNINGIDIQAPEFESWGHTIEPAAWVMGSASTVRVGFKAVSTVSTAQIWAENGLGGLNSNAAPVIVSFAGGYGQDDFTVNSVPNYIAKNTFQWDWRYKNINSSSTATETMGTTQHIVYTVLATPQEPQLKPWLGALDIASDLASYRTTAETATRDIWEDFYLYAGGAYDTINGASQYGGKYGGVFHLSNWLNNYGAGNIGIVNCYDMAQSVVVFANALGCDAEYILVDPFGYLNCVKPIGKGWTNNPFYDDTMYYNPNPIVDGDASYSSDQRSSFGNHSFARVNNNLFDASGGQVDVDTDPDDCPPHTPRDLDGNDTWTNDYRNRVIDDNPSSNPGTLSPYSLSVQ